jgi:hypothetical protein
MSVRFAAFGERICYDINSGPHHPRVNHRQQAKSALGSCVSKSPRYTIHSAARLYHLNMELIDSVSSELLLLSIQHVSIPGRLSISRLLIQGGSTTGPLTDISVSLSFCNRTSHEDLLDMCSRLQPQVIRVAIVFVGYLVRLPCVTQNNIWGCVLAYEFLEFQCGAVDESHGVRLQWQLSA